jgi:nemo like kinase
MQGTAGPTAGGQQGGLHAAQPYYHPQHAAAPAHTQEQVQPDRPIGYGAFGVVW